MAKGRRRHVVGIDGFQSFNFGEGNPYVSITKNGLTFNKSSVIKTGYPKFVILLINEGDKKIAIQTCAEETPNATKFYKEKKSGIISVRWNSKDLLNKLQYIMGWDLNEDAFAVDGVFLREQSAIVFDLTKAKKL